jgi:hypothetical protein
MKCVQGGPTLHELTEEEALGAVVESIRNLFPFVTDKQSRELARAVIRRLANSGVVLSRRNPSRPPGKPQSQDV